MKQTQSRRARQAPPSKAAPASNAAGGSTGAAPLPPRRASAARVAGAAGQPSAKVRPAGPSPDRAAPGGTTRDRAAVQAERLPQASRAAAPAPARAPDAARAGRAQAPSPRAVPPLRRLGNFLRTPKGTVLLILLGLVAVAAFGARGIDPAGIAAAASAASAVELAAVRLRRGRWLFPSGALLTGLFVALVLSRQVPPDIAALTAGAAVAIKHAVRTRWSNVFNPAALALVACALVFHTAQSWWITLPKDGVLGFALVLGAAWYVAAKINKLPLGLAFLLSSLLLFTLAAFLGDTAAVAQVFRAPDINALVFFAGFMLSDPPTSPARHADQLWFGALAGVLCAGVFLLYGVQWFILAGLPVANACESVRRVMAARARAAASAAQSAAGRARGQAVPPRGAGREGAVASGGRGGR